MNYLVVGGAGFLGANLVRTLVAQHDANVTVLDSLEQRLRTSVSALKPVWKQIHFIRGSMCDEHLIAEAVQNQDVIIVTAAQTSHPLSLQDPIFDAEINCLGNLRLLESVRLLNPSAIVVFCSSSTVIGKAVNDHIDETHPERPLDIYSANKGVAEKYYSIYHNFYDLKTICLRFSNLYGPFGKGYPEFGFLNYFISLASKGEEIKIFGSGDQLRNILFVQDAVDAILAAANSPKTQGQILFACSDEHLSVAQIASKVVSVFTKGKLTHIPWPDERKRIEVDNVRIKAHKFADLTGWKPRFNIDSGLAQTLKASKAR